MISNVVFPLVLLVLIASFLTLTNSSIPFSNGGSCDPWHYFGQFFLADQPHAALMTRDEARVPEFLVGYLLHHILRGIAVHYANFAIFFISASFAVYHASKRLFGLLPAVIATTFFATQPLFVGNSSLTYTEGVTAYSAISFALAIASSQATRATSRLALALLAGFFWGAAINAHLESLTMNFIVALYCLDWGARSFRAHARDAAEKWSMLLAGALIATGCFGAVNSLLFHRTFWFFVPQIQAVFTVAVASYRKADWYLQAGRGALIVVGLAALAAQSIFLRRHDRDDPNRASLLTSVIPFAALMIAQLAYTFFFNGLSLEYDYWFVWILAPLALMIASMTSRVTLTGFGATISLFAYVVASLFADLPRIRPEGNTALLAFPLLLALVFSVASTWLLRSRPKAFLLTAMACLVLLNLTIRPEKYGLYVWTGTNQREAYQRIYSGMDFLSSFHFEKTPKFWVNGLGEMWETIAYPRSYSYCVAQYVLPHLIGPTNPQYNSDYEHFSPGDYLVMAVADESEFARALKTLREHDLRFRKLAEKYVSHGSLAYSLIIGKVY